MQRALVSIVLAINRLHALKIMHQPDLSDVAAIPTITLYVPDEDYSRLIFGTSIGVTVIVVAAMAVFLLLRRHTKHAM